MSDLRAATHDYLAVRRRLGFELRYAGALLEHYVDFMERAGAELSRSSDDRSADTPSACSSQSTPPPRVPITKGEARHPAHTPPHQRNAAQSQERRHRHDRAVARA
jgi:hypothetical protein